jgi:hypothetical protein
MIIRPGGRDRAGVKVVARAGDGIVLSKDVS